VHADDEFRVRVLAEEDVEARMELIRSEGFDCTADEIAGVLFTMAEALYDGVAEDDVAPRDLEPGAGLAWDVFHPN
jgi:hypothetical protein